MKSETRTFLESIFKIEDVGIITYEGQCHDCKKDTTVDIEKEADGKVTVRNGAVYPVQDVDFEKVKIYIKCDDCFQINQTLTNFRKCAVYSRVVGFLRPVSDWNKGKTAEWNDRKSFKLDESIYG